MSVLIYNSVTLPFAHITQFSQEAVGDDSNTDLTYIKFDIQVSCVINYDYLSMVASDLLIGGNPSTKNPADIMRVIHSRLMARRKSLSFKFNGFELIPRPPTGNIGTVDARNGPIPQSCIITEANNTTFLCNYHIIAHYWENNKVTPGNSPSFVNQPGNKVITNRWSEIVDINSLQQTKFMRQGKFAIRSDNTEGLVADQVRTQMAVVGVRKGFLRENARYTLSPDGLAIQYEITDQEQFKMPPSPAFEASGTYNETVLKGAKREADVTVILKGSNLTSQVGLVTKALQIAGAKLAIRGNQLNQFNSKPGGGFNIPQMGSVKIDLYSNVVEVSIKAMYAPKGKARVQGFAAFAQFSTFTPGSPLGSTYVPNYFDRGSASLLLQAAAYYDPSLTGVQLSNTGLQLTAGALVGKVGAKGE